MSWGGLNLVVNHTLLRASAERPRSLSFWIIPAGANWCSTKELVVVNYRCCGWTLVNGTCGYTLVLPDPRLLEWRSCKRRPRAVNPPGSVLSDLLLIRKQEMKGSRWKSRRIRTSSRGGGGAVAPDFWVGGGTGRFTEGIKDCSCVSFSPLKHFCIIQ